MWVSVSMLGSMGAAPPTVEVEDYSSPGSSGSGTLWSFHHHIQDKEGKLENFCLKVSDWTQHKAEASATAQTHGLQRFFIEGNLSNKTKPGPRFS